MQRFYFDTSVFGGVFDMEFKKATLQLFERVKLGEVTCVFSAAKQFKNFVILRQAKITGNELRPYQY